MTDAIPKFKMPKKLYEELSSQASWRHNPLSEEIRIRLNITMLPEYRVW